MNAFVIAATTLIVLIAPLLFFAALARPVDGVVALSLVGTLATLATLCLAEGLHRSFSYTVAVVAGVMTVISTLVFARFLGRWL
jgi:multisubunit Na+/H+ antiporter MnhF subunit